MTSSLGSSLLGLIENDALIDFAPALVTFLTGIQGAAADPIKLSAVWVQLQGNLVAAGPTALGGLEGQLAGIIVNKIQGLLTAAQTANTAAIAALSAPGSNKSIGE